MAIKRVSRIALSGTNITMTIGRHQIACRKASYGDKLETDSGSNMGSQQIDFRTMGTYTTDEAKITMESVVFRSEFMPLLQQNGFGNEEIPIIFSYSHPDLGDDSDLLDESRFTNLSQAIEASNKALEVDFGIVFNQLYLTDERKTINAIDPSVPLTTSNF